MSLFNSNNDATGLSKQEIYEKICLAYNTHDVNVIAPYLADQISYIEFGRSPFISEKSEFLEFLRKTCENMDHHPDQQFHATIEEDLGEMKPFIHFNGIDMVYDVFVEDGIITKILRRPPYSKFKFDNSDEELPLLLQTAGNCLNDYFTNNVTQPWCWVQTWQPELTFQDFCIAYDNYALCIVVGLVRQTFDNDPQLFINNQKLQNLLRVCEQNNMTPCLCLFDPAGRAYTDGCPLFDARTFQPLDLNELKDDNDGKMSAWELQNLGVRYIFDRIVEQGYTDPGYCDLLEIAPQIFFKDGEQSCYVFVRSIPMGMADEKFKINAKTLESVKDYKGYFVDLRWAALMGGSGLFDDQYLRRRDRFSWPGRNRSNLTNNGGQMVDIEKAIQEFPFIEVVNE